jgi:hypothetical protein
MEVLVNDSSDLVFWGLSQYHIGNEQTSSCMSRCRSLSNVIEPLILTLHEKLGIDRSAMLKELVEGLDSNDEVNMHDPVLEDTRESDEPHESLKERERLLKEGQGMTIDEMASALAGGV